MVCTVRKNNSKSGKNGDKRDGCGADNPNPVPPRSTYILYYIIKNSIRRLYKNTDGKSCKLSVGTPQAVQ